MFYLIVILATDIVAILLSGFLTDAGWGWVVLGVLAETVGVIAFDGLQAWIIRWFPLPKRWFSPESRAFRTPGWERKLYRKLKIGKWKRLVAHPVLAAVMYAERILVGLTYLLHR